MNIDFTALRELTIGEAAGTAIFGYCVVFFGLVLLMCVLYITGAYFKKKDAKSAEEAKAALEKAANKAEEGQQNAASAAQPVAPGSAGHVKLHGVPDKEAAMIMAIVADKMQTPLNELHFISIKEVK